MALNPTAKFEIRAEDKTAAALRSAQTRLDRFSRQARAILGAATAFLAGGALASHIRQTIDQADAMLKLTQRIGGTTEALSELEFVAERSGVAFNTLSMGLQRMVRRIAEAAEGTGEAKGALKELGLDAERLRSLSIDQQFEVIADALFEVKNESDRVRLAMKLFDSEGVALLQTMTDGAEGIRDLREEARKLGVTLTDEQAKAAQDANDALTNMNASVSSLSRNLTLKLAPAIARVAENWNDLLVTTEQERIGRLNDDINRIQDRLVTLADKRATFGPVPQIVAEQERLANLLLDKKNELDAIFERQRDRALGSDEAEEAGTAAGAAYVQSFEQEIAKLDIGIPSFGDLPGADRLTPELTADRVFPISEIVDGAYAEVEDKTKETTEMMSREFTGLADDVSHSLGSAFSNLFMGVETGFAGMLQRMAADFLGSQLSSILTDFFGSLFSSGGLQPFDLNSIGGRLPGFQHGGSFTVGGAGGPDSQLVAFRATPGEKVTVGHQTSAAGATIIEQHFHVQAGLPPQWEAQLGTVTQIAATAAKQSVGRELGGRR